VTKKVSDLYSAKVSEENQGALGMGCMQEYAGFIPFPSLL